MRFLLQSLIFLSYVVIATYHDPHDDRAILLNSIPTLIFRKGARTTGRRTSGVPQMTCVGGGACGSQGEPPVIMCTNIGVDYQTGDPNWKCTAEVENGYRLGTTDVVCEGFRDRDDPYILKGSCGLEYTLSGYSANQQAQGSSSHSSATHQQQAHTSSYPRNSYSSSGGSWINWIFGALLFYAIISYCFNGSDSSNYDPAARSTFSGANGGGGGGGFGRFFGGGGGGGGWGYPRGPFFGGAGGADCAPQNNAGGGFGFWPGLGLGTGLGYLFGRNNNGGYNQPHYARNYGTGYGAGYVRPSPTNVGGAGVGPATQTATGYGGTRRRG